MPLFATFETIQNAQYANWLLTGAGEMLFNENEVRESDERKWSTPDLRKRIERVEDFLKGKFEDFE